MASLLPRTPCQGLLPVTIGGVTLTEIDPGPVTHLELFRSGGTAAQEALQAALGLAWPAPGRVSAAGAARLISVGPGQALLLGAAPPALEGAACVDQSDAWAAVQMTGTGVTAALARLVPVDLDPAVFPPGCTARTLVGHMTASVTRTEAGVEIMAFRSMAQTLVHELSAAARHVAARGALHAG